MYTLPALSLIVISKTAVFKEDKRENNIFNNKKIPQPQKYVFSRLVIPFWLNLAMLLFQLFIVINYKYRRYFYNRVYIFFNLTFKNEIFFSVTLISYLFINALHKS